MATRQILVTGANQGIGKAIAEKILTDFPDTSVIVSGRHAERVAAAVAELASQRDFSARVDGLVMDVADAASVAAAAQEYAERFGGGEGLYGLVNNAGIGFGHGRSATVAVNFWGVRRVTEAFLPLLRRPGGRIVNIASASGPNFVRDCGVAAWKELFAQPLEGGDADIVDAVAQFENGEGDDNAYGFSKAALNAYTAQLAAAEPELIINSCSPGYINTQLTAGMGARNPPSKGALSPCFCLFEAESHGWYYGSDCVRSPIDRYRDPGDPPFEG